MSDERIRETGEAAKQRMGSEVEGHLGRSIRRPVDSSDDATDPEVEGHRLGPKMEPDEGREFEPEVEGHRLSPKMEPEVEGHGFNTKKITP